VQGLDLVVSAHLANGGWWEARRRRERSSRRCGGNFIRRQSWRVRGQPLQPDGRTPDGSPENKSYRNGGGEANRFVKYTPKYRWTPGYPGQVTDNYPTGDSKSEEIA
jgi:hypothetical protein